MAAMVAPSMEKRTLGVWVKEKRTSSWREKRQASGAVLQEGLTLSRALLRRSLLIKQTNEEFEGRTPATLP